MNWYKKAQYSGITTTINTKMDVIINLSVGELLAIDKFVTRNAPTGPYERATKEVLLRILRELGGILRMDAEGKIKK